MDEVVYIFNEHNVCLNPKKVEVFSVKGTFEMFIKMAMHEGRCIISSEWSFLFGSHEGSSYPCSYHNNGKDKIYESFEKAIESEKIKLYNLFLSKLETATRLSWHKDEKERTPIIKQVVDALNPNKPKQLSLF